MLGLDLSTQNLVPAGADCEKVTIPESLGLTPLRNTARISEVQKLLRVGEFN
jgi:hypothetical protein